MFAPAISDVDKVAVRVESLAPSLPTAPARGRTGLWRHVRLSPNAIRMYFNFASARRELRRLRRSIMRADAAQVPQDELLNALSQAMGRVLPALRETTAVYASVAADLPVYRPAARQLAALRDAAEDLQETTALASSARFRKFVERSLEAL